MKKFRRTALLLCVLMLISAVFAPMASARRPSAQTPTNNLPWYGSVNTQTLPLNVRSGAGTNFSVVGTAPLFGTLHIVDRRVLSNGEIWLQVYWNGSQTNRGWVSGSLVFVPPNFQQWSYRVTASGLNFRSSMSTTNNNNIMATIPNNAVIPRGPVDASLGVWTYTAYRAVRHQQRTGGFVHSDHVVSA